MSADDAWLDAFTPDELQDPALDARDAAVGRVLERLDAVGAGAPPLARPRNPWLAGAALAALAAVALLATLPRSAPVDAPTPPIVQVRPPSAPPPVVLPPSEPAPPVAPPRVAVALPPAPEAPVAPPPGDLPGLEPFLGARVIVRDGAAVLSDGLLGYVHDAAHTPGVNRVVWASPAVVARPTGTAFLSLARPALAALSVSEGRVELERLDGTLLAVLGPGDEAIACDLAGATHAAVVTGLAIDELAAATAPCDPAAVIAAVSSLRLARRGGQALLSPSPSEAP